MHRHSFDSSVLSKRFERELFLIKAKLIGDSIVKIYGDTSLPIIEKQSKDTDFIYTISDYTSTAHDALISSAYKIPSVIKPLGWVSDYGHMFTKDEVIKLDSTLKEFEKATTNEIAVVTFDSSFTKNQNFDSLVINVLNFWGVGKAVKNNGILIGISPNERKIRISNGYGIEAKLSDEETKKIIDDLIVPEFKKDNYYTGINKAIIALMEKIK